MKQEGYKFSGLSVLEIVGTVLFFFSLFMPWVEGTNFMGSVLVKVSSAYCVKTVRFLMVLCL